jgi:hypothetical protein
LRACDAAPRQARAELRGGSALSVPRRRNRKGFGGAERAPRRWPGSSPASGKDDDAIGHLYGLLDIMVMSRHVCRSSTGFATTR